MSDYGDYGSYAMGGWPMLSSPHPRCDCHECTQSRVPDYLRFSNSRIVT